MRPDDELLRDFAERERARRWRANGRSSIERVSRRRSVGSQRPYLRGLAFFFPATSSFV